MTTYSTEDEFPVLLVFLIMLPIFPILDHHLIYTSHLMAVTLIKNEQILGRKISYNV